MLRYQLNHDPVKAATMALTPGRDRVKDSLLGLSSQHLCRVISASFAFMCTASTKTVACYRFRGRLFKKESLLAGGRETWLRQISSRIVKNDDCGYS